jgi:hypothetical protein
LAVDCSNACGGCGLVAMAFAVEVILTGGALVSGPRVDEGVFRVVSTIWAVLATAGAFKEVVAERLAGSDGAVADAAVVAVLL